MTRRPAYLNQAPRSPGRPRPIAVLAPAFLVAALLAGCGGSTTPGVAHLASATRSGDTGGQSGGGASEGGRPSQQQLVTFAKCMRSHGVTDFPEPVEGRLEIRRALGPRSGLDPRSAAFRAAGEACRKLLPNGGQPSPAMRKQVEERALKFSACMRSHGVPNFPEPEFQGDGVRLALKAGRGLDPGAPQFQAAQKACRQDFGPLGAKGGSFGGPPPGGGPQGGGPAGPGGGHEAEGKIGP